MDFVTTPISRSVKVGFYNPHQIVVGFCTPNMFASSTDSKQCNWHIVFIERHCVTMFYNEINIPDYTILNVTTILAGPVCITFRPFHPHFKYISEWVSTFTSLLTCKLNFYQYLPGTTILFKWVSQTDK